MIKQIHVLSVFITASLFILRGLWVLMDSRIMQQRWVRIVPHINDTVLLVSAIFLAVSIQQYPFVHHWLTAKVIALLGYIGLGMVAMRKARSADKRGFIIYWVLALLLLGYIILVALSHQAWMF